MYPEVIANYAKHHKTGEPIPDELLKKVIQSRSFNQGFDTLEYVAAALLDMEWHSLAADATIHDIEKYQQQALALLHRNLLIVLGYQHQALHHLVAYKPVQGFMRQCGFDSHLNQLIIFKTHLYQCVAVALLFYAHLQHDQRL